MNVYHSLQEFPRQPKAILTIGTFDGVHVGHQQIIRRLREIAVREGGQTVVLTFFPHPRMVLQPDDNSLQLITTMEERKQLLNKFGIDHLIIQPFDKDFSRLSATEFVRDVLVNSIGLHTLVIGYDHHFGRNREGSYRDLEEMASVYGFQLEEIPEQDVNEVAVSSTKIRQALQQGNIAVANRLLGHDFTINGAVVQGDRIGRTIGFPTANIQLSETYKQLPKDGIYAVMLEVEGRWHKGMLYIGMRPVVDGNSRVIEVNIFDFDQEIYGKQVSMRIKERIRDDRSVDSLESLKILLEEDRMNATKILS